MPRKNINKNNNQMTFNEYSNYMGLENKSNVDLKKLYDKWFLEYASYVILERAIPHALDGLKPVQRRILHSLKELDDGRYNKVANVIGNTMKYHPHGDASIGDAITQIGQKGILFDTQGNWGNIFTGDSSAAPRYIEVRLSEFSKYVAFNNKTTNWLSSYDGRNKEPEILPIKFPLLLAQGAEGIAVGLSSKILPHNFNEIIDACICYLRKKPFEIYPDFLTGGIIDISEYNNGERGGKIRVRAKIETQSKNLLVIKELPFGKNTITLIESILSANDKGKIKISKVEDNTAENVEILIYLPSGSNADVVIQRLYAFTDCELSISTNLCVIKDEKPQFLNINHLIKISSDRTKQLIEDEFKIELNELEEQWHASSLERIFIEEKIYRKIENEKTWDGILKILEINLKPFEKKLKRKISESDRIKLLEIKIKKISKYDSLKSIESLKILEEKISITLKNLKQINKCTINWFQKLKEKYGSLYPRKTIIKSFEKVVAQNIVRSNENLYVNKNEGFAGYNMKKDELVCKCSNISDIISINQNGILIVKKVSEKSFFGKKIMYIQIFNKSKSKEKNYCMIYRDGKNGPTLAKHFNISGVTRDKEYHLTKGSEGSEVYYIDEYNPSQDPPILKINLKPAPRLRKLEEIIDFSQILLKGRNSKGIIITKNKVRKPIKISRKN